EAMKSNSMRSLNGVLELYDFSRFESVADIAGGFGHLAIALLQKYPNLRAIVMDMPKLMPIAKGHLPNDSSVTSRIEFIGGDMFEDVPSAQVYIMKHIIHDWDDARCVALLQHCVKRMQGDGRVLCVDAVLPPAGDSGFAPAKFLDLNMLVSIPGKERTLAEWKVLYDAAGLKVTNVFPLHDNFGTSIIEGVKK
ncbi:MAG: methyltransferase, partial [Candidatus Hydrogenedentota bacterium]